MDNLLEGKVALVTGAGRGVGRAHALHLASLGACVVVNDLGTAPDGTGSAREPAEQVCREIRAAVGRARPNFGEVADEADAASMIAQAVEVFGRLDVLVCNAGIIRRAMMHELSADVWDTIGTVNLRGHFLPARAAARHWLDQSAHTGSTVNASIVLTSSRAGLAGSKGCLGYAASKAAIAAMAVVTARELEPFGVRANAVCPRGRTRMTEGAPGYREAGAADGFDVKAAENNSPMVGYLASDLSREVTGQVFVVGEDNVQWMRGWSKQGELRKPGARLSAREIHEGAGRLFQDMPTRPDGGLEVPPAR